MSERVTVLEDNLRKAILPMTREWQRRLAEIRTKKAALEQERELLDAIIRLAAVIEDFSQMAVETTDPDPAYRRAYADITKYVREKARSALET